MTAPRLDKIDEIADRVGWTVAAAPVGDVEGCTETDARTYAYDLDDGLVLVVALAYGRAEWSGRWQALHVEADHPVGVIVSTAGGTVLVHRIYRRVVDADLIVADPIAWVEMMRDCGLWPSVVDLRAARVVDRISGATS